MCSSICWEENRAWMILSLIGASPTGLLLTSVYLLLPYDCRHLLQSKWRFLLSVAFSLGPVQCVSLIPMMSMILKVISLATCAMLPLLYSVRTFQFPIFTMFWGVYQWPFQLGGVLLDRPQCSLDKVNFSAFGFCENRVLRERVISPQPNLGDQGTTLSLVSIFRPGRNGCALARVKDSS